MSRTITADQLFKDLTKMKLENSVGMISFQMAGVSVKINRTDIVGLALQSWLKQYFVDNDIYFKEPRNTQEFPDFYLGSNCNKADMLEVKAFKHKASPGFDIANFDAYCSFIKDNPYRLDADYLIFGYEMSEQGDVCVKKIWLHKIWQIVGRSERFPIKTQIKRNVLYNIRPGAYFKFGKKGPFDSREDFISAIYKTLIMSKSKDTADEWLSELKINYKKYYGSELIIKNF